MWLRTVGRRGILSFLLSLIPQPVSSTIQRVAQLTGVSKHTKPYVVDRRQYMGKLKTNIALVWPSSLQRTALRQGVTGTVINTVGGYILGKLQGVCCSAPINKSRQTRQRALLMPWIISVQQPTHQKSFACFDSRDLYCSVIIQ